MSLFIGNISKTVTANDLEKSFNEYGSCKINYKGTYAFAEFDSEKDAEDALDHLQSKNLGGRPINIEWSKKSKRYDASKSKRRRRSISPRKKEGRCYNCGSRGHYLRDCREKDRKRRYRSRSRSRSRSKRRKSSRKERRSRSRSRSSRSHSNRRRRRSPSSSSSRKRSESSSRREKSPYKRNRSNSRKDERNGDRLYNNEKNKNNNVNKNENDKYDNEKRSSRSSESERSKNKNIDMYTSRLDQILDNDMIPDNLKNGPNCNEDINKNDNTMNSEEFDYNKMKVDDLKNELKKKNLTYPKNARKSDLIDLLLKKDENK